MPQHQFNRRRVQNDLTRLSETDLFETAEFVTPYTDQTGHPVSIKAQPFPYKGCTDPPGHQTGWEDPADEYPLRIHFPDRYPRQPPAFFIPDRLTWNGPRRVNRVRYDQTFFDDAGLEWIRLCIEAEQWRGTLDDFNRWIQHAENLLAAPYKSDGFDTAEPRGVFQP